MSRIKKISALSLALLFFGINLVFASQCGPSLKAMFVNGEIKREALQEMLLSYDFIKFNEGIFNRHGDVIRVQTLPQRSGVSLDFPVITGKAPLGHYVPKLVLQIPYMKDVKPQWSLELHDTLTHQVLNSRILLNAELMTEKPSVLGQVPESLEQLIKRYSNPNSSTVRSIGRSIRAQYPKMKNPLSSGLQKKYFDGYVEIQLGGISTDRALSITSAILDDIIGEPVNQGGQKMK